METKHLKLHRNLIVLSALLLIVPYGIYQVAHYYYNVDLDRMYFITSSLATILSFFVIYRSFNDLVIRTVSVWVAAFFAILLIAYAGSGLILGVSYVYIKWALLIGTLTGITYFFYDYFTGTKT